MAAQSANNNTGKEVAEAFGDLRGKIAHNTDKHKFDVSKLVYATTADASKILFIRKGLNSSSTGAIILPQLSSAGELLADAKLHAEYISVDNAEGKLVL